MGILIQRLSCVCLSKSIKYIVYLVKNKNLRFLIQQLKKKLFVRRYEVRLKLLKKKSLKVASGQYFKCFIPRRDSAEQSPKVVQFFYFRFYWCRKGYWGVSILRGVRGLFENLENFLSPGGTLQSRARKGSSCFYFTFYWCRKRYWGCQIVSW